MLPRSLLQASAIFSVADRDQAGFRHDRLRRNIAQGTLPTVSNEVTIGIMPLPINEVDLARTAFVAAHGRFLSDHNERGLAAWYASLGETLWWIFALDEHYRNRKPSVYERYRDDDPHGQVISGLRLARNRVGHQLALMLEDPKDHATPAENRSRATVDLAQLVWRQPSDLPPGDPKKERPPQVDVYRRLLAGEPARYTLRRANYFFVRRRTELESIFSADGYPSAGHGGS